MKYKILTTYDSEELETLVNEMIQEGWKPIGSVSVSLSEYQYESRHEGLTINREEVWAQAIIKE